MIPKHVLCAVDEQMALNATKRATAPGVTLDDIDRIIKATDCGDRMGGECFAWAIAIKNVLLPRGSIDVVLNEPIWRHSRSLVGHAAVHYRGRYFDAEGETDRDRLEDWGATDPEDADYAARAGMSLEEWSASDAFQDYGVYSFTPKELVKILGIAPRVVEIEQCLRAQVGTA